MSTVVKGLSELRKVRRSGVISRYLVRCCVSQHLIFFARRMSLRLAIRAIQAESGERSSHVKESAAPAFYWQARYTYLLTDDHTLVYWLEEDSSVSYHWQASSLLRLLLSTNSAMHVRSILTLYPWKTCFHAAKMHVAYDETVFYVRTKWLVFDA